MAVLAAGLPNITGVLDFENVDGCWEVSGVFQAIGTFDNKYPQSIIEQNSRQTAIDFNASRSSAIYGASDTVQPPALVLLPQIKY